LATVLDEVDCQHLLTQLLELVSVKTLHIFSGLQALGRWLWVGFPTLLRSSAVLVTLLALGTFISFTPFATFATDRFFVRLPRTNLEIPMIVGTRAAPERMIGVGKFTVHAEATR
jgi:hypothetical protein